MHQDYNNFAQENEEDDGWVSRSSRKRHSRSLREIGKQVVALAESELEKIPFGDHDSLREACFTARKMKPRSEEPHCSPLWPGESSLLKTFPLQG